MHEAVAVYRKRFQPSEQLDAPYVIAGVNVITADTAAEAQAQLQISRRGRVRRFFSRDGQPLSDDDADFILRSPQAASVDQMMKYTAVGTPDDVEQYLEDFARRADADELMVVFQEQRSCHRARSWGTRSLGDKLLARALYWHERA